DGTQGALRLAKPQGARDRDSGGTWPPEQADRPRYRHRRSHGEGASQQGDAEDEGPLASRARPNGRQAQAGAGPAATLLIRRISPFTSRGDPTHPAVAPGHQPGCTPEEPSFGPWVVSQSFSEAYRGHSPNDARAMDRGVQNRQIASHQDF